MKAVEIQDFENHLGWVIGLEARSNVEVFTLQNPPLSVIDLQHPQ